MKRVPKKLTPMGAEIVGRLIGVCLAAAIMLLVLWLGLRGGAK